MSSLVSSVGNMVEAGVKGLIGLADSYYNSEEEDMDDQASRQSGDDAVSVAQPRAVPIQHTSHDQSSLSAASASATTNYSTSSSTTASSSIVSKPIVPQGSLVQILDVPSGWIHLQSTYLDGAGARKVRSFGLKNLSDTEVDVTVGSDLDDQILFWAADDERGESSGYTMAQ